MRHVKTALSLSLCVALFGLAACGDDDPVKPAGNNGGNNDENNATNNATNNDVFNNDDDNGATNNGATNNGDTNNGDTNNGDNPLPIDEATIDDFCEGTCAGIGESCGGFGDLGADEAACIETCTERVGSNGEYVANYACYEQSCSSVSCPQDEPIAISDTCVSACEALDGCDLLRFIDLPEDEPEFCQATCSGAVAGNVGIEGVLSCIEEGLGETCNEDAIGACFDFNPLCEDLCTGFLADTESDDYCEPGTPIYDAWPDVETCQASCEEFPSDQRITLFACLLTNNCGDPGACADIPAEPFAGCVEACEVGIELCDGAGFGFAADVATCSELCTGFLWGFDNEETLPDAGTCLAAELDMCPEDEGLAIAALLECTLTPTEDCALLCDVFDDCLPAEDNPGCTFVCLGLARDQPEVYEDLITCLAGAGDECGPRLSCFPPEDGSTEIPEVCTSGCTLLDSCNALEGTIEACAQSCANQIDQQPSFAATAACTTHSTCDNYTLCSQLPNDSVPTTCTEACAADADACGDFADDACQWACFGASRALALDPSAEQATCVVGGFGASCDGSGANTCQ